MVAENVAQRRLQQMHRRVVSHRGKSFALVYASLDLVADRQRTERNGTFVQIDSVCLFGVAHEKRSLSRSQHAFVSDLSAAFRIERGSVKHNGNVVALFGNAYRLIVFEYRKHFCGIHKFCISAELGLFYRRKHFIVFPCGSRKAFRRTSCGLFLLRHQFKEAFFVGFKSVFGSDFSCQVYREAERVVKSESLFAVKNLSRNVLNSLDYIAENGKTLVYRLFETVFFLLDDFLYIRRFFTQFGISGFAFVNNDLGKFRQEMRLFYAEKSAVTRRSSQKAAKNVTSALV